jgi:hypothetical protein
MREDVVVLEEAGLAAAPSVVGHEGAMAVLQVAPHCGRDGARARPRLATHPRSSLTELALPQLGPRDLQAVLDDSSRIASRDLVTKQVPDLAQQFDDLGIRRELDPIA